MSDASQENPQKRLRLARDLNPQTEATQDKLEDEAVANPEKKKLTLKLNKSSAQAQHEIPADERRFTEEAEDARPVDSQTPTNPIPGAVQHVPEQVNGPVDRLKPANEKQTHSLLPSVIVILLLFLILAGAGYGLWKVLLAESETDGSMTRPSTSQESSPASTGSAPSVLEKDAGTGKSSHPIQRAKETIAKIEPLEISALSAADTIEKTAAEAEAENAGVNVTDQTTDDLSIDLIDTAQTAEKTAAIESTKASVTQYLGSVHIGGMRQGARPMVLIDGRTYHAGEVVRSEYGLKFDGIRDGKLAFIDQNNVMYLKSF
ncbi:MAG: hypothetical protein EA353_09135 [Puniceicoccaceae bacterium]|nr:MAG: hypothetical protein EA353_09135 [Puniceicoccaceae bacterium]